MTSQVSGFPIPLPIAITPTVALVAALLHEPDAVADALAMVDVKSMRPQSAEDFVAAALLSIVDTMHRAGGELSVLGLLTHLHSLPPNNIVRGVAEDVTLAVHRALEAHKLLPTPAIDVAALVVRERAAKTMKRKVAALGNVTDPVAVLVECEAAVASLPSAVTQQRETARRMWRENLAAAVDPLKPTRRYIPTGIPQLDGYLRGGYGIGELSIEARPTNEGKSLWIGMLARNVQWPNSARRAPTADMLRLRCRPSSDDVYMLLIMLEDPASSVIHRWLLDFLDVETKQLDEPELRREVLGVDSLTGELAASVVRSLDSDEARVEVVDADMLGGTSGDGTQLAAITTYMKTWTKVIRARCKALGLPEPRLCVGIDHVQCIALPPEIAARINREQQMSAVAKRLLRAARQEDIAVVATAMLNGRVGANADEVEIRESAGIEQAAHLVVQGHTTISFADALRTAVKKAIEDADGKQSEVLERRLELALQALTLKIKKSRTTAGRGKCVTTHVDFPHQRITRLSDSEAKLAGDLLDDVVGWARKLVATPFSNRKPKQILVEDDDDSVFGKPAKSKRGH
jgi:hypothetical protein